MSESSAVSLRIESREPAQRPQAWHEAVLAASHGDELRQAVKAAPHRFLWNREDALAVVVADERILLSSMTDEIAVRHPLRLHELELLSQVRTDQQKHAAAVNAVILEDARRHQRSVARAAPDEVVEIDGDELVLQRVARIDTTDVRAEGALQSLHVLRIGEFVVANEITPERRIVAVWTEHQGSAAAPAAHHFCGDQLLLLWRGGVVSQVATKRGNVHVKLANRHEGPVLAQLLWNRRRGNLAALVGITHDELAGLDGRFAPRPNGRTTALDVRVVQSVLEAERIASFRQFAELHAVYDGDLRQVLMRAARELEDPLQVLIVACVDGQSDVDVFRTVPMLPVGRCISADVMQDGVARRHPLPELDRKTVERSLWHAQRLEALEGERDPQPAGQRGLPPLVGGGDMRDDPPQHLPPLLRVTDAENHVLSEIGSRARAQNGCLYVACFDYGNLSGGEHYTSSVLRLVEQLIQRLLRFERLPDVAHGGIGVGAVERHRRNLGLDDEVLDPRIVNIGPVLDFVKEQVNLLGHLRCEVVDVGVPVAIERRAEHHAGVVVENDEAQVMDRAHAVRDVLTVSREAFAEQPAQPLRTARLEFGHDGQ